MYVVATVTAQLARSKKERREKEKKRKEKEKERKRKEKKRLPKAYMHTELATYVLPVQTKPNQTKAVVLYVRTYNTSVGIPDQTDRPDRLTDLCIYVFMYRDKGFRCV